MLFLLAVKESIFIYFGICLAIGTEVTQQFIPSRGLELWDGIMDISGLFIGYFLYLILSIFDKQNEV